MVGSSDSIASPNTVLNTIVAEAFKEAADMLEKAEDFDMAVHDFIKETLAAHKRIILTEMAIQTSGWLRLRGEDFQTSAPWWMPSRP